MRVVTNKITTERVLALAESDKLAQLGSEKLSALMSHKDSDGNTFLHELASLGLLAKLPSDFLSEDLLLVQNYSGFTPFQLAPDHANECFGIPRRFFTKKMLFDQHKENPILHLAASNLTLGSIPKEYISQTLLLKTNSAGKTAFHAAVESGDGPDSFAGNNGSPFCGFPEGSLTNFALTYQGNYWCSPLHLCARDGLLNTVPVKCLTPNNLGKGVSDAVSSLPSRLLTKVISTGKSQSILHVGGIKNCYHLAAESGDLGQFPRHCLLPKYLMSPDDEGITPLQYAREAKNLDGLLGIWLPRTAIHMVGQEWWEKNRQMIDSRKQLEVNLPEPVELGLF